MSRSALIVCLLMQASTPAEPRAGEAFVMSSATLNVLLDCASVGRGTAVCQQMQSEAPHPLSGAPDATCPLLTGTDSTDVPAEASTTARRQYIYTQPVHLALAALLVLNAAFMLGMLRRRGQHGATAAGTAVAAAPEACSPIEPAGVIKPPTEGDEPCVSRCSPATVRMFPLPPACAR